MWERLNLFGVCDMARRIADAEGHMTASADWQKYKMEQAGASAQEIRQKVQELNAMSDEQVKEVFEEAVQTSYENDSKVFEDAGMTPPPFNGEEGRKLLQTLYDQTNGELYNFTRTTANRSQRILIQALDDAMLRVTSGLQSKEMAIQQAIERAAAGGLYVEYPSGHRDTIEVAVRRAVQTGVNQASLRMCVNECETVGTNYVIVSSHLGARTGETAHADHSKWQGGIYRLKERKEGFWSMFEEFRDVLKGQNYPLLEEATGYPSDPLGLGGYNCRHNMMPYFPGISENHMKKYGQKENEEAYLNSQKQRAMERRMRALRRQIEALRAGASADGASDELKQALRERRKELEGRYKTRLDDYRQFCKDHGLNPATERTYIPKAAAAAGDTDTAHTENEDSKRKYEDQGAIINRHVIGSENYHKAFQSLGENAKVTRELWHTAKQILNHRSGTKYEDLSYTDSTSGKTLIRDDYNVDSEVLPGKNMIKTLKAAGERTIIAMHNHPGNAVPSKADLRSAKDYKYGLILCHNGKVYKYSVNKEANIEAADFCLDRLNAAIHNNSEEVSRYISELQRYGVNFRLL